MPALLKKKITIASKNLLGKRDRKRLLGSIQENGITVAPDNEEKIFSKTEEITVVKIPQTKIQVYFNHIGDPMFMSVDRNASGTAIFLPTLYTLRLCPNLIPSFTIHPTVSKFILGGADLNIPGIMVPENIQQEFQPTGLHPGKVVGIRILNNQMPFAVGRCVIDETGLRAQYGKAVDVLHVFGDGLCSSGYNTSALMAECHASMGIPGRNCFDSKKNPMAPVVDESKSVDTQTLNGCDPIDQEENPKELGTEPILTAQYDSDDNEQGVLEDTNISIDDASDRAPLEDKSEVLPTSSQVDWSCTIIDEFLKFCLLEVLHTKVTDDDCPLHMSALYSLMGQVAPQVAVHPDFLNHMKDDKNVEVYGKHTFEEGKETRTAETVITELEQGILTIPCDIKRSSHRKLAKFIQHFSKQVKLLQVRKLRDNDGFNVVNIQRQYPLYKAYSPITKREAAKKLSPPSNPDCKPSHGDVKVETRSTLKNSTPHRLRNCESSVTPDNSLIVKQFFLPTSSSIPVFKEASLVPELKGKYYFVGQCREVVEQYINRHSLQEYATQEGYVILDDTLRRCVLKRKERQETDETKVEMALEEVVTKFISLLTPFYIVMKRPTDFDTSGNEHEAKVRQGEVKPIVIREEKRQMNKVTTSIHGLDVFMVDPKVLTQILKKSLAASAAVVCAKGTETQKEHHTSVVVQGSAASQAIDILTQKFGVPRAYIVKS